MTLPNGVCNFRSPAQESDRLLIDEIARDIRIQQEAGEITDAIDPKDAASLLVATADGLQLQWLLDPGGTNMVGLMTRLWETLKRVK